MRFEKTIGPEVIESDIQRLSWHDNLIHGFRLEFGDPDSDEWRSDLVFDIDHIVEWLCDPDGTARFRVAPATLTFHDVTNLSVTFDFGDDAWQVAPRPLSVDQIDRERPNPARQRVCLDLPYWRWRVLLNDPRGGQLAFGASGLHQALRAEPTMTDQPLLPRAARG